jgi:outer membrane receptor for ferrienterochelin and colicins
MTQGIEFTARMQLGREWLLTAAYTYTDSEDKETGNKLNYVPEHEFSFSPFYENEQYRFGASATLSCLSEQYSDTDNTNKIEAHSVVDAKIFKWLGKNAKLSFEADNIFDSDKGQERSYRTGQVFTLKLDINF